MKRRISVLAALVVFGSTLTAAEALPALTNADFQSG